MPEIHPFRALHYDPARAGDLSKVVAQPYDKVDDRLREEYYARDPHHIIRVDKRKEEPEDDTGEKKYGAAAATLESWVREGALVEDPGPGLYAVHQAYTFEGTRRTRKGICAMVRLEEYGAGRIHPHEETHSGPKIDRLKLLRATETHLGHIFLLYSDPAGEITKASDAATSSRPPDLRAVDDFGEEHAAWRIGDREAIRRIVDAMGPREAIIADGHHRYETALAYRRECAAAGRRGVGAESFDNVLATLVNMDDPGLTCFPTHRVIKDRPPVNREAFLEKLSGIFDVKTWTFANGLEEKQARSAMLEAVRADGKEAHAFGLALPSVAHARLRVRDTSSTAGRVDAPRSIDWRSLDVNLLHTVILEKMMRITPDDTAHERFVDYVRSADEAVDRVVAGRGVCAFIVNPVRMEQIRRVVRHGERFPQKSTDFYPKMLSGFLMCRLRFEK